MSVPQMSWFATLRKDLIAGLVVFLVAIPLCLGIALASNAPPISGILAGIIGGILVGVLSGSHTSVSGPAAGLTAVVAAQIHNLGSFEAFLVALVLGGVLQLVAGLCRLGFIAEFFPSSVIKGLLAAIGLILILKQIPHVIGHDDDPEGDMAFFQPDHKNTFSFLFELMDDFQFGATAIGLTSLVLLILWERVKFLKKSIVPGSLVVVVLGILGHLYFLRLGSGWAIESSHLVQVPVMTDWASARNFFQFPDFSQLWRTSVWVGGLVIAIVASLETLLNLEAIDKLDPKCRVSPPNRELVAQGVGNLLCGLIGALPITSVVVRSSVNINSGGQTKLATILHGFLIVIFVAGFPWLLNLIPLSCLAAVLIVTGFKLARPALFVQMWREGLHQFLPFIGTVVAIMLTDLLVGILIGLAFGIGFILHSNLRRPLHRIIEQHVGGEVWHLELASQLSFLNRAGLAKSLNEVPANGHLMLDARHTDYIDPDVLDLIEDFKNKVAPARNIHLSLIGFQNRYRIDDQVEYVDYSTKELQEKLTPDQVLQLLKEGNERFRTGKCLVRDVMQAVDATARGQFPLAVILSCIDSRTPAEPIFDLGLGDIFSIRIAGNVAKEKVLGSMEYACVVAGSKLIVVVGHSKCGAVKAAVDLKMSGKQACEATGCDNLDALIAEIQKSIAPGIAPSLDAAEFYNDVARRNVLRTVAHIRQSSRALERLEGEGKIRIVGAFYHIETGKIEFLDQVAAPSAVAEATASA